MTGIDATSIPFSVPDNPDNPDIRVCVDTWLSTTDSIRLTDGARL